MGLKGDVSIVNCSFASTSNIVMSLDERKKTELFHIRVIFKHTKIDTLIYSGSQVNLISEQVVRNLGLEMKPHPKPYPLGWVCTDAKLHVSHQCKLNFSITSKFVYEVELDVVPLDICRIVLGSPYLYDRKYIFFPRA
jgi:hypothetical protein